ncbi:phage head-binding domain-containing protein [Dickeya sp. CFBP 2040]|uniref:phage head-binding domain-containing protein n=1 Tax=Dickeya sp. CFBP 2040 TaxID=2718531 RepID=UPI001FF0DDB8|nr:phage head-binding domain-containing protein [Dickeya sp. CFBP 2040]
MADSLIPNIVVSMPSQYFSLAHSFKANANGKIYIGAIDTDPTIPANQIQVYVENEDGSHVPVAQPIVINAGGYPVYNEQIAKFVTVQGHSMAIYDAYNEQQFYFPNVLKYEPDQLRIDLSSSTGTYLIGKGDQTLDEYLEFNKREFDNSWRRYVGHITTMQKEGTYSGEVHYNPVSDDGKTIGNYTFESPVIIDFASTSDYVVPSSGVIFKLGVNGLTQIANFSQDNYRLKNFTAIGGTPEIATFEPFTGLTAVIENVRIINNGEPSKYAINFKGQNWWPTVSNSIFKDYTDKKGNFCKAIDDGGESSIRRSGNSRLLFTGNKVWFGGSELGGSMLTASAVFNIIRDNACEHAENAVVLQYPSAFSCIDGLYAECFFGGGKQILIGDKDAEPSMSTMPMYGIKIKNIYFNNHSQQSNRLIAAGNNTVAIIDLVIDDVTITNPNVNAPVIEVNDVPGQSIYVGNISSGGMPLINKTNNAVKIIDINGNFIKSLNGNLASGGPDSFTVKNGRMNVFGNCFINSNGTFSVSRYASGDQYQKNRESKNYAAMTVTAGTSCGFEWQNPRYTDISGRTATVQFLAKSSTTVSVIVLVKCKYQGGVITLAASAETINGGDFQEFTIPFYASRTDNDDAVLSVELRIDASSTVDVYVCAYRLNRGETGLCRAATDFTRGEIDALLPQYVFI